MLKLAAAFAEVLERAGIDPEDVADVELTTVTGGEPALKVTIKPHWVIVPVSVEFSDARVVGRRSVPGERSTDSRGTSE